MTPFALPALSLVLLLAASPACAEKADRDKPMLLEANRILIDDAKKTQILEGEVAISKGTLVLRAERIIITQDAYGFQKGTAFAGKGKLATLRQKREGHDDYIEGEAERIEYDGNREVAELFQKARVQSGADEVRGDYIWYDAVSEKYLVTADGDPQTGKGKTRVRAVIQPRKKTDEPSASQPPGQTLQLKGAAVLDSEKPPAQQ